MLPVRRPAGTVRVRPWLAARALPVAGRDGLWVVPRRARCAPEAAWRPGVDGLRGLVTCHLVVFFVFFGVDFCCEGGCGCLVVVLFAPGEEFVLVALSFALSAWPPLSVLSGCFAAG